MRFLLTLLFFWCTCVCATYKTPVSISELLGGDCAGEVRGQGSWIARLKGGSVFGDGVIATADQKLVDFGSVLGWRWDLSWTKYVGQGPLPTIKIPGKIAVLASQGEGEYYHWLLQVLGRFVILQNASEQYDRVFINVPQARFQSETLGALGMDAKKVLYGLPEYAYQADELIVPAVPNRDGQIDSTVIDYLRNTFLKPEKVLGKRKIYISREDARRRRILNESELWDRLKQKGFERVLLADMTVEAQARLFASADTIVAPHGSGLANLVFADAGTHVIEIHGGHEINPLYGRLSEERKLYYQAVHAGVEGLSEAELADESIRLCPRTLNQILTRI